jgi:serine/threonine protein kinase
MDRWGQGKPIEPWSDASALLRPGTVLGRYELLLPIGFGGMACVWAARLEGYGGFSKLVAVKTILPHLASSADVERMLLDEARIAADVHHPNVCNLFDVGEDHGVLYLVMEWVNGDSLLHLFRQTPTAPREPIDAPSAARIVADACAGLHAAHELSDDAGHPLFVVHRDVSPHNILVSLEGAVKMADFGVAKANGQLHETTRTGEVRGKIAYMAPEQIDGGAVDRRADIFAMGCVLYEATTGQQPFSGDNEAHVIRRIMEGTYEPAGDLVEGYSPELAAIVVRCLDPRPSARFETAGALHAALEGWLNGQPSPTTPTQLGALVRARIGTKLDGRAQEVRAAMARRRDSTRPKSPPAAWGALAPFRPKRGDVLPAAGARRNTPTPPPLTPLPAPPDISAEHEKTASRVRDSSGMSKVIAVVAAGLLAVAVAQAVMAHRTSSRGVDVTAVVPVEPAGGKFEVHPAAIVSAADVPAEAAVSETPPARAPVADAESRRRLPGPSAHPAAAAMPARGPATSAPAATGAGGRAVLPANPY